MIGMPLTDIRCIYRTLQNISLCLAKSCLLQAEDGYPNDAESLPIPLHSLRRWQDF